jgi:hypothetical protein
MDVFDELENLARTSAYDEPDDGGDIHDANRRIIKIQSHPNRNENIYFITESNPFASRGKCPLSPQTG